MRELGIGAYSERNMTDLGEQFRNKHLVELENYLCSTAVVRTTAFEDDDPLPSFWSNADNLAADGAVLPQTRKGHGFVRLAGAVCLAYIVVAALDPQFQSSSARSLLPTEQMAETIKPGSLAVQEAVTIVMKTPPQVQKGGWGVVLVDYKTSFVEPDSTRQEKARKAENEQVLRQLKAWMNKGARAKPWRLVVVDLGQSQGGKAVPQTASSASQVLQR
jgi:hypothetical protein